MSGSSHPRHLTLICGRCRKRLRAPASAAGKRGRCAKCGNVFVIPAGGKGQPIPAVAATSIAADPNGTATVPVEVVLRSGMVSGGIIVALAVLVAVGVISYMVFFR